MVVLGYDTHKKSERILFRVLHITWLVPPPASVEERMEGIIFARCPSRGDFSISMCNMYNSDED